jgi:hypothetical protein
MSIALFPAQQIGFKFIARPNPEEAMNEMIELLKEDKLLLLGSSLVGFEAVEGCARAAEDRLLSNCIITGRATVAAGVNLVNCWVDGVSVPQGFRQPETLKGFMCHLFAASSS